MERDEERLVALRAKMTNTQRKEMADIIGAELKRREQERKMKNNSGIKFTAKSAISSSSLSSSVDRDQLGQIYADVGARHGNGRRTQQLNASRNQQQVVDASRINKRNALSEDETFNPTKLPVGSRPKRKLNFSGIKFFAAGSSIANGKTALLAGILILTILKVIFSNGAVNASIQQTKLALPEEATENLVTNQSITQPPAIKPVAVALPAVAKKEGWSEPERELLSQLDQRRVELERRRELLDAREAEVRAQADALAERLAELRTLTVKLSDTRKNLDHRYEERMEQLANVYGSMQPKEAAPLIAKLDDPIALGLLERLPSKRLGQILSLMPADRAIELTKSLSDRKKVQ
jgi:flagellar motility protein MotE (MotC chaperone)